MHKGIATLSGAVMISFLLLAQADINFFHLQLLQSAIYLIVILMLFYLEDHWAYMLGMIAPAVWLALSFGLGTIPGSIREVGLLVRGTAVDKINALDLLTATLCTVMIIVCARRWRREYANSGKGMSTFLVTLIAVGIYYAILIYVYWKGIPQNPVTG